MHGVRFGKASLGRVTVGLTDSVELLRSRSEGDRRAWALTFHVCCRPSSDKGRVGFFAGIDVREFGGRPVGECRGLIGRKPTGKGYTLTSTDVTLFEQSPDGWLASDAATRNAVSEVFAAFLDGIGQGTGIFVRSRLAKKSRRGGRCDEASRAPAGSDGLPYVIWAPRVHGRAGYPSPSWRGGHQSIRLVVRADGSERSRTGDAALMLGDALPWLHSQGGALLLSAPCSARSDRPSLSKRPDRRHPVRRPLSDDTFSRESRGAGQHPRSASGHSHLRPSEKFSPEHNFASGVRHSAGRVSRGELSVIGRNYFARQAATLLKFAQSSTDPAVAAALVEKAADLKSQADESALPDSAPLAPDIELPSPR